MPLDTLTRPGTAHVDGLEPDPVATGAAVREAEAILGHEPSPLPGEFRGTADEKAEHQRTEHGEPPNSRRDRFKKHKDAAHTKGQELLALFRKARGEVGSHRSLISGKYHTFINEPDQRGLALKAQKAARYMGPKVIALHKKVTAGETYGKALYHDPRAQKFWNSKVGHQVEDRFKKTKAYDKWHGRRQVKGAAAGSASSSLDSGSESSGSELGAVGAGRYGSGRHSYGGSRSFVGASGSRYGETSTGAGGSGGYGSSSARRNSSFNYGASTMGRSGSHGGTGHHWYDSLLGHKHDGAGAGRSNSRSASIYDSLNAGGGSLGAGKWGSSTGAGASGARARRSSVHSSFY